MQRRNLLKSIGLVGAAVFAASPVKATEQNGERIMSFVEARDGTKLFCRSWGKGRPVAFVSAWMLNSQAWQYQMLPLSEQGFRTIAYDRRGHGRSDDPGRNYGMDTLAGDLASVLEAHDVRDATLVGHSLGCGEIVRYLTNHGSARVRNVVLIAPITPHLLKSADNPDGMDEAIFEGMRAAARKDFPGILAANIKPFFDASTSQAMMDWMLTMMTQQNSLEAILECNKAYTRADFRQELPKIALPVLLLQGDADMSAPLPLTGRKTAALLPNCRLEVYEGAPHGLIYTHMERVNADIRAFAGG